MGKGQPNGKGRSSANGLMKVFSFFPPSVHRLTEGIGSRFSAQFSYCLSPFHSKEDSFMTVITKETVKVVNKAAPDGFMFVNRSDYDEGGYTLWTPPVPKPVKASREKLKADFSTPKPKMPTRRSRKTK
jgi:hypothetical protein